MARVPVLDTSSLASKTGVQNSTYVYAADAGSNDSYAITLSPAPSAYAAGQIFTFYANTVNTGAASLNVNALGAKTIKKANDQDLANGDIEAGQIVTVAYNGTDDVFEMISQTAATLATGDVTGPAASVDNELPLFSGTGGKTLKRSTGTGVVRVDSGVVSIDSDITDLVSASSEILAGKVELATSAEVITGTDTARAVTPAGAAAAYLPIAVDGLPNADDTASGPRTNSFNAGATVAQWDLVYMGSASKWLLADADAASSAGDVMLAMCLEAGTDTNPLNVALPGTFIRNDGWNWTVGAELYADTTPGAITETAPSATDDVIRVIGYAVTADVIYFNPSNSYTTHT